MASTAVSPDLDRRSRIHDLVVDFYREVNFDDLLAPVFGEVAEVDWSVHIPTLIDFWCRVLLGEPGYDGFVLGAHQQVHDIEAFRPEHFDRWYGLWVEAVDRGWQGPNAERAKAHAARIAAVLARRLVGIDWAPAVPTACIDEPSAPDGPGGDRRPGATTRVGPPLAVTAGPPTPDRPARGRSTTSRAITAAPGGER